MLDLWARIIKVDIFCRIRVVGLRYIVCRINRLLGMLAKAFLVSMQHWIKNQANHQESIIDMDGELCGQVISLSIDPGSNYSYVSPDLVDKCGSSKVLHAESWLVQLAIGTKK